MGLRLPSARILFVLVAVACAGFIGTAIYMQQVMGLEPCPLCILQRYVYVVVGVLALVAAVLPRLLSRFVAGLAILMALAGAATGGWHVWLQLHPPVVSSCGGSFEYLVGNLPLGRALPGIFRGYADCSQIDWSFLGLTIPGWSIICLLGLSAALVLGIRSKK